MQTEDATFEQTKTSSRIIAEMIFSSFLEREELDGKPVSAHLVHLRSRLAVHRFDTPVGDLQNWQGGEMKYYGQSVRVGWADPRKWKAVPVQTSISMTPAKPKSKPKPKPKPGS